MSPNDKPLVWLHGEVHSPPFSDEARIEAGYFLRLLQKGLKLSLPHSRPMPSIGKNCHELRIRDKNKNWRIVYRIDNDGIIIVEIFEKKTEQTPQGVIKTCQNRLSDYDSF